MYFTLAEAGSIGAGSEPVLATYLPPSVVDERLGGQEDLRLRSVLTQCDMFFRYLRLTVMPNPGWMSIDVQRPLVDAVLSWWATGPALGLIGYGIGCIWLLLCGGLRTVIGFGLAWPLLFFATELVAIRVSEVFVIYRCYLWLPGLCLAVTLVMATILRHLLLPAMIGCVFLLAYLATKQLETFRNPAQLWSQAIATNRQFEKDALVAFRAYLNRGYALAGEGQYPLAVDDYNHALALSGGAGPIYLNRGVSYALMGQLQAAVADFDRALDMAAGTPDSWRARIYANRANAMALLGQLDKALADIQQAVLLDPHSAEYRDNQRRMRALQAH